MGGQSSKYDKYDKQRDKKPDTPTEYQKCFDNWHHDQGFMNALLVENPKFTHNLLKQFPDARNSYQDFTEMVLYLRRYDPNIQKHTMAKYNISHTTLLDRYFMICLGFTSPEQLETTKLGFEDKENLMIEYMKIFIPDPKPGFLGKLCAYISDDPEKPCSLKEFSSLVREHLPHAQKHLKDYYMHKFRDMSKDGRLLRHFPSTILVEDAVILSMKIAQLAESEIKLLYSSESFGLSFHSIEKQIFGYTGPWLLLVEHYEKDNEDKKVTYRFGSYQSGPINDVSSFQGDLRGFLFTMEPKIRFMTTDHGENGKNYFYVNTLDEKVSKMRKGIGFGGDKFKENFKLWIDEDLDKSKVHNGNDPTYGFGALASISTKTLSIRKMEIWGLGSHSDLKNQEEYWKERYEEIMKRRKVNKKDLVDGNAGMFFEKTFAHRDQVYGVIEKKEEEKDK